MAVRTFRRYLHFLRAKGDLVGIMMSLLRALPVAAPAAQPFPASFRPRSRPRPLPNQLVEFLGTIRSKLLYRAVTSLPEWRNILNYVQQQRDLFKDAEIEERPDLSLF